MTNYPNKIKLYAALLFLTCIFSHAYSSEQEAYLTKLPNAFDNTSWNLMLEEKAIKIYTRPWPGSDFVAIKGVQTINSSLSNILANFIEISDFPEWVKDAEVGRVIEPFNQNYSRIVYLKMAMPWPLQDRDMVSGQQITQDPATKIIKITEWYEGDAVPKEEDVIRIPRLNTEFLLIPKEKNSTLLIWQGHNDPGGRIPAFLVNWLIKDVFLASMISMKNRFEAPEHLKNLDWVQNYED